MTREEGDLLAIVRITARKLHMISSPRSIVTIDVINVTFQIREVIIIVHVSGYRHKKAFE